MVHYGVVEVNESAERSDGSRFSDHDVRNRLKQKGFANPELEWMVGSRALAPGVVTAASRSQQARLRDCFEFPRQ